jgi:hypothetical protein
LSCVFGAEVGRADYEAGHEVESPQIHQYGIAWAASDVCDLQGKIANWPPLHKATNEAAIQIGGNFLFVGSGFEAGIDFLITILSQRYLVDISGYLLRWSRYPCFAFNLATAK